MAWKKNKPEIRFKGFSEEWEMRELFQLVDVRSGRDYKHLSNGDIPVYGTGGYMLSVNKALSYEEDAIGIGRKGTIDKPYILKAPFWTVDTLFYAVPIENNNIDFIYDVAQKINWKQKDESTGVPSLSKVAINGIQVFIPKDDEQSHIGNFFKHLDTLITLHQQKYDKLVTVKKAMLEKMFPQNGAVVPEIRFKGFNGDWEERTLGDVADLLTGYPFESKNFTKYGISLIRGINVKRGQLDLSENICEYWPTSYGLESYLLKESDILIQMDGALIGKSYAKICSKNLPALLVQRVTRIRSEIVHCEFIYQWIQKDFLKYILTTKTETAVPHLSLNDIRNFKITIPSAKEQSKIGKYFQNLDNLITLQQRELEKLKNIKKACLEKMFV